MDLSMLQPKIALLPQEPGVYFFRDAKRKILYIGKATSLRSRVQSYFRSEHNRGQWISRMVSQIADITFLETDSVLEALILETNLIKKYLPKYNTLGKDDKSSAYFVITKEEFPKVLILRKTDISKIQNKSQIVNDNLKLKNSKLIQNSQVFGPYASKHQMQIALKIMRRIFPFHSNKQKTEKGCLDFQLGLCSGPYAGAISKENYKKNIRGIRMILEGKKKRLVTTLEKEMQLAAKKNEFEKAAQLRNRIFALNHIRDVALISKDFESNDNFKIYPKLKIQNSKLFRIEAYDISNISGQSAVGSMVVFSAYGGEHWQPNKSEYRKFKIKTVEGSNDVAMMREVLLRRFKNDWSMPDLILLDGGIGHFNMAEKLLREELGLAVMIAAVAKGPSRKNLKLEISSLSSDVVSRRMTGSNLKSNQKIQNVLNDKLLVKHIMDEAHRFAIAYHRKLRGKTALQ